MNTITLNLTDDQYAALQAVAKKRSAQGKTVQPEDVLLQFINERVSDTNRQQASALAAKIATLSPAALAKVQAAINAAS